MIVNTFYALIKFGRAITHVLNRSNMSILRMKPTTSQYHSSRFKLSLVANGLTSLSHALLKPQAT